MPRLIDRIAVPIAVCLPASLAAQSEVEVHVGRWYQGNRAATYEVRTDAPLAGAFSHGFAVQVFLHDSLGRRRAFYGAGYELHALRRRANLGPYALAGATVGLSTDTSAHALAVVWSAGAGLEWRPVSWVALGVEARYRVEDRGPRGFWRPRSDARDGVSAAVGVSLAWGRERGRASGESGAALPAPAAPVSISGGAADVVRTALDAIGTPYRWGGTAENGFDCSGLVQYAYAVHGIRLPRMSRDQAVAGSEVPPVAEALRPGDVLLFSEHPRGGVTHVGLYVGEGKFIHSSNRGVKLSWLDPHDAEGAWWIPRWVGARRIVE